MRWISWSDLRSGDEEKRDSHGRLCGFLFAWDVPVSYTHLQMFQAVSYAVKDIIIDEWIATHKEYEKQDAKTVYYLSMEFLMGRAPVSYTHLDVYKRQGLRRGRSVGPRAFQLRRQR